MCMCVCERVLVGEGGYYIFVVKINWRSLCVWVGVSHTTVSTLCTLYSISVRNSIDLLITGQPEVVFILLNAGLNPRQRDSYGQVCTLSAHSNVKPLVFTSINGWGINKP